MEINVAAAKKTVRATCLIGGSLKLKNEKGSLQEKEYEAGKTYEFPDGINLSPAMWLVQPQPEKTVSEGE